MTWGRLNLVVVKESHVIPSRAASHMVDLHRYPRPQKPRYSASMNGYL
jgi:hypothetical protein